MIPYEAPHRQNAKLLSDLEKALRKTLSAAGDERPAFEAEIAAHEDAPAAVAAGSLVDALELALRATGIPPQSQVLVPAYGGPEPVLAALRAGHSPVFVDVDPETGCLDPKEVASSVTAKTAALIASSVDGRRAPIPELRRLCARHGLHGIENATDTAGLGAPVERFALRVLGFSSHGPLSVQGSLAVVLFDDRAPAAKARSEVWTAPSAWDMATVRLKLPQLTAWTGMRRTVAAWYHRHLRPLVDRGIVSLPTEHASHAWAGFAIRVPRYRDEIASCLRSRQIGVGLPAERPLPERTEFRTWARGGFPVTQRLHHEILRLPIYPELTGKEFQTVVNSLTACSQRLST